MAHRRLAFIGLAERGRGHEAAALLEALLPELRPRFVIARVGDALWCVSLAQQQEAPAPHDELALFAYWQRRSPLMYAMQSPLQQLWMKPGHGVPDGQQHEATEQDEDWYDPLRLPLLQERHSAEQELPQPTELDA